MVGVSPNPGNHYCHIIYGVILIRNKYALPDTALPIARRNVSFSLDSSSCASPAKAPDAASARTIMRGSSWECIFVPYENITKNNMAIMIAGIR